MSYDCVDWQQLNDCVDWQQLNQLANNTFIDIIGCVSEVSDGSAKEQVEKTVNK